MTKAVTLPKKVPRTLPVHHKNRHSKDIGFLFLYRFCPKIAPNSIKKPWNVQFQGFLFVWNIYEAYRRYLRFKQKVMTKVVTTTEKSGCFSHFSAFLTFSTNQGVRGSSPFQRTIRTDIQKMSVFCFLYPPNIAKSPEIADFRAFLFYCNKNC